MCRVAGAVLTATGVRATRVPSHSRLVTPVALAGVVAALPGIVAACRDLARQQLAGYVWQQDSFAPAASTDAAPPWLRDGRSPGGAGAGGCVPPFLGCWGHGGDGQGWLS